jgi:hypothetical protein
MRLLAIPVFISSLFLSCSSATQEASPHDQAFRAFIKKFPVRQLPFQSCITCNEFRDADLASVEDDTSHVFVPDGFGEVHCWGLLPDTSEFYYTIWTVAGDNAFIPFFAIYDKKGNLLSYDPMTAGKAGWSPCFRFNMYTRVNPDYSFTVFDTTWTWDCDSSENVCDSNKVTIEATLLKGKIAGGKFIKQEEKTNPLKP